ncbi:nonstructural protein 1 [Galliform chaphamaparvovirus 7]|nr:nonstructural protein 1 [Galliform chaphamaparvovirus 7]
MQSQVECSGTGVGYLFWSGSKCTGRDLSVQQAQALLIEKEHVLSPEPELTRQLKLWDMKQWVCCICQICKANGEPILDPIAYAIFLNDLQTVSDWVCAGEFNKDKIFHCHVMLKTTSRSDSCKRAMETLMNSFKVHEPWISMFEQDTSIDCVKIQSCHKPSSMLSYMTKDPCWITSNSTAILQACYDIDKYEMNLRFKNKIVPQEAEMNMMTKEITDTIVQYSCKTIVDIMRAAPEIMAKYLHRPGLSGIIQNCLTYVEATGGDWNISLFDKYDPNPEAIHKVLLFQGISPSFFDQVFHSWIQKTDSKRNTICIYGPSNTGKSTFIAGLKACVPWGECVNGNNFNFEGLLGSVIGVWEEPLIGPETAEKFKQISEGMPTNIPVKYKKPQLLPRTPIIMTTNHWPWRWCTGEEQMFRNRMHIFHFEHDCKNQSYTPRTSEHSCKCRYCTASSSCSPPHGESSACRVQTTEQPLPAGKHGHLWTERPSADVCSGSLRDPGEGTSGSYDSSRGSSGISSEEQCTDSSRPTSSTSTSTEQLVRYQRHEPSDSRRGIHHTEPFTGEHVEPNQPGRSHGDDSGRTRETEPRKHLVKRHHGATEHHRREYSLLPFLEPMGQTSKKAEEISVSSKKRRVDRVLLAKVGQPIKLPMYPPSKQDWGEYLSWIYHIYG